MAENPRGGLNLDSLKREHAKVKKQLDSTKMLKVRLKILNQLIANYGADAPSTNGHVETEYEYPCPRKNCDRVFSRPGGLKRHLSQTHGRR